MKKKCSKHSSKKDSIKNKKRSLSGSFSETYASDEDFLNSLTENLSDISEFFSNSSHTEEILENIHTDESLKCNNSSSEHGANTTQNNSNTSDSKTSSTTAQGPSGFSYAGESPLHYRYGFTNSEFFAFLASLDAIEYIIFLTLISVLILINLNKKERLLVYNFFITLGQTIGSGVEQTNFQEELKSLKEDTEKGNALQTDFDYIYTEMGELQAEIKQLKEQLKTNASK